MLYRFGRAYPGRLGRRRRGAALHGQRRVAGRDGRVLARSDAQQREAFLSHVAEHRAPRIAAHWASCSQPLVSRPLGRATALLRFRQIEYYRMPMMAYLALDDPRALTRNDFIRLGAGHRRGRARGRAARPLPYAERHLADFEQRYCYDRFWADAGAAPNTRYLCNGRALIVVGDAQRPNSSAAATAACWRSSATSTSCCS